MAINTVVLAQRMTGELDKAVVQKTVTGFFADNAVSAKFVGAKTVLIPSIEFSGLGDYDRDNGFVRGSIAIGSEPYTLTMDRGRSFQLDREDNDETGISGLAGQVMGEFVRTRVVPEMDAYCLSKLGGYAAGEGQTVALGEGEVLADKAYALFTDAVNRTQEAVGFDEELVAFVNPAMWAAFQKSGELTRQITISDFRKGEVSLKVKTINEVALLPTAANRMKTGYEFLDGTTAGKESGGFSPLANAKSIGLLVLPRRAASLVKKTETVRVFEPGKNQKADAWQFDYRVYYDLLLKNSLKAGITVYAY